nr:MAG TPA: hypothetical protein [Caudoviricetes sp.]
MHVEQAIWWVWKILDREGRSELEPNMLQMLQMLKLWRNL